MTEWMQSVLVLAAVVSAVAAFLAALYSKRSADAAKQAANVMKNQLTAEEKKRYDALAGELHLWKFQRYIQLTAAVVDILGFLKAQDKARTVQAYTEYHDAHRNLLLLIDSPVLDKGIEFGALLQDIMRSLVKGQWPSEAHFASLDESGRQYMRAMQKVLYATTYEFVSDISDKYVDLIIDSKSVDGEEAPTEVLSVPVQRHPEARGEETASKVTVVLSKSGLEWRDEYGREAAYLSISEVRDLFPRNNHRFEVIAEPDSERMQLAVHGRHAEGHYVSSRPERQLKRWLVARGARAGDCVNFSVPPVEASGENVCYMTLSRSDRP